MRISAALLATVLAAGLAPSKLKARTVAGQGENEGQSGERAGERASQGVSQREGLDAGRRAYDAGDYDAAERILKQVADREPENGEIELLLAKTYYEMQEHDAAIASAEKAVTIDPGNSVYHEWLGKAYGDKAEHAGWFSALSLAHKTRKEFETAVRLDEHNFAARQALVEFDCSAPGIAGGGEDKAQPHIAKLAAMDAAEGYYAKGNCRRQKKDFAAADAEFRKALDSHPKSIALVYDIGDYAMKREDAPLLLEVANTGERESPSDPRGKFYRAVGFILKRERATEAERFLRGYAKIAPMRTGFPRRWMAHEWLGRLYENEGKTEAARQEYEAALKLDAKDKNAEEALKRLKKS